MIRRAMLVLALTALWAPSSARAEDEHFQEYGHDWVVSDHCQSDSDDTFDYQAMSGDVEQVVYLNFDGAKLSRGQSNSQNNSTSLVRSAMDYPAMEQPSGKNRDQWIAEILKECKILYLDFAVKWVTERPTSGDYTMVMVGGSGTGTVIAGSSAIGVAPLDCKNSNKNDIVVILSEKIRGSRGLDIALVIAHELGHSFGLEHMDNKKDIMYYAKNSETCCWTNSPIDKAHSNTTCGRDPQDAKKVLATTVGMGAGDTIKPLAWFQRPGPGAVLPSDFTFAVEAADNFMVRKVAFFIDDKEAASITATPYTFYATGMADGDHTIKAVVYDANPKNKVELAMGVTVDSNCVPNGSCYPGETGVGLTCATGDDCATGLCAVKEGQEGVCTVGCTPQKEWNPCPSSVTCKSAGGTNACVPGDGYSISEAAGCNVAGDAPTTLSALLPLLGLLFFVRRRRNV